MPRIPIAGEVWTKGSYRRLVGNIGRVEIAEVLGTGLKATVMFTFLFGSKRGHVGRLSADRFIKVYEFDLPSLEIRQRQLL